MSHIAHWIFLTAVLSVFFTSAFAGITQASAQSLHVHATLALDQALRPVEAAASQEPSKASTPEQPKILYLPIVTAPVATHPISGQIKDTQGNAMEGVTLTSSSGKTAVTDSQGRFSILELAGAYTLVAAKAGYTISPNNLILSVPPAAADLNMTAASNLSSITGRVTDLSGAPIAGITITTHTGQIAVTDTGGNYTLANLPAGTYTYSAAGLGHVFSPLSRTATLPPNISGKNFTSLTPVPVRLDMARFYHSQLSETTLPNACGPASLLIALDYFGVNAGDLDQVILATSLPPASGGFDPDCRQNPVCLSAGVLASVAQNKYHLVVDAHDDWTFDQLYRSLLAGRPVIVDMTWGPVPGDIGHFVVVYGVDPDTRRVYYHDPYYGPSLSASWTKFYTSWQGPVDVGDPLQPAGHRAWGMAVTK